jgi:hypothetical protein
MSRHVSQSVIFAVVALSVGSADIACAFPFTEHFNQAAGVSIPGLAPDSTVQARTWQKSGLTNAFPIVANGDGTVRFGPAPNAALALDIRSGGSFVKPSVMTISATFDSESITDTDPVLGPFGRRGVYVGFWGALPNAEDANSGVRAGVAVDPDDGTLRLVTTGAVGQLAIPTVVDTLAYTGGTWDPLAFHTLSYGIDTTTGDLSNVLFDSQPYDFVPTAIFDNTTTNFAGFGFSNNVAGGFFDAAEFKLSAIQPGTCDVNGDSVCNSADFDTIVSHMFTSGGLAQGDVTGDGLINIDDFRRFKDDESRVLSGAGGGSLSTAVPEPTSMLLIGVWGIFLIPLFRRKKQCVN